MQTEKQQSSGKFLVIGVVIGIVVGVGGMAAVFVSSGLGTSPNIIRATIGFDTIDNQLKVVGLEGTGDINPTLVVRTGYNYELTVINNDSTPHSFVIGDLGVHTGTLEPGDSKTVTIHSLSEGEFTYFDGITNMAFGKVKIVTVGALQPTL